jgi:hypothetical protein
MTEAQQQDDVPTVPTASVESPPPSPVAREPDDDDPRAALHRLAEQLMRTRNRRILVEYLRLRRLIRFT